ncbi:MAG: cytochrome b/b6 domain-containing protein [Deltaproteobacteria bacterium]|nr:cytochrome b/b6 domain-containing protein [Deltaproteobacteria bacterium]
MNAQNYRLLPAWDPVLRFLHWWNVFFMSVQVATGAAFMVCGRGLGEALETKLVVIHGMAGLLFGGGLFGRILWLFIGPEDAQWRGMLPISPAQRRELAQTVSFYLKGFKGVISPSPSHNAFAGPVYLAYMIIASAQIASGSALLGLPDKLRAKALSGEIHETCFVLILAYAGAHLIAVFIHELTERHGLVAAMIHGKKTFTQEQADGLIEKHPHLNEGGRDERED